MTYLYVLPFTMSWTLIMFGLLAASIGVIAFAKRASIQSKDRMLKFLGFYLLFDMVVFEYYFYHYDAFSIEICLPLAYCSIMQLVASYAALKKSRLAFEFALLLGICGPFQAFLSPVIVKSGEMYLLVDYFIAHTITILVPVFMMKVLNFRPRKLAFLYTIFVMQMIVIGVFFVDITLGANYMYLVKAPINNLLISGPWPTYVIHMHVLLYFVAILTNLFFILSDWLDRKTVGNIL